MNPIKSICSRCRNMAVAMRCAMCRERILENEAGAWYTAQKPILWAYAGGGRLHTYGNSKEAIADSISRGLKILELDVALTSDGVPVLSHWFRPGNEDIYGGTPDLETFLRTPINGKYKPLTLEDLFEQYGDFDGYFALDPYYITRCGSSFNLAKYLKRIASAEQQKKIIYQLPNIEWALKLANNRDFASLHFSLPAGIDSPQRKDELQRIVRVLTACGVHSVSMANHQIEDSTRDAVALLRSRGIHVSIAGVDTIEDMKAWLQVGVDIFNSRLLTPDDIKEVAV